jgi:hypothetical protein
VLEGKSPIGRPRYKFEYYYTHLKDLGWDIMELMHLTLDGVRWRAVENVVMNLI